MKRPLLCSIILFTLLQFPLLASDKAGEFAGRLPSEANTISVVHLDQILNSKRGLNEGWTEKQQQSFLDGHIGIPPWIDTLVMGSLTHPGVPEEMWAAAILSIKGEKTLADIAKDNDADIATLADLPSLQTRTGAYLAELSPGNLAGYRPAHRQDAIAWINSLKSGENHPKPYLVEVAQKDADIVMGIDLRDMFDVEFVELYLQKDPRFTSQRGLIPALTPLLSTLRGVSLEIHVGKVSECQVTVNFEREVGPQAAIVKTLFVTAIEDAGAGIEEFRQARIKTDGEAVILSCNLSDESVLRILSMIVPPRISPEPPEAGSELATNQPAGEESNAQVKQAARRYVDAVKKMTDDLRKASERLDNYKTTIAWHRSYADKIDRLSTNNVPPELVDIGHQIANEFRGLARSLNGQKVAVDAQNNAIVYDYHVDPGWAYANIWGGAGYRPVNVNFSSNLEKVREKQAEEVTKGQADRDKIWDLIAEQTESMNAMLEKL